MEVKQEGQCEGEADGEEELRAQAGERKQSLSATVGCAQHDGQTVPGAFSSDMFLRAKEKQEIGGLRDSAPSRHSPDLGWFIRQRTMPKTGQGTCQRVCRALLTHFKMVRKHLPCYTGTDVKISVNVLRLMSKDTVDSIY